MYFSDFVDKSVSHSGSRRILMCKVLMGNIDTTSNVPGVQPGFQSKTVNSNSCGMSEIIVIDKEVQILPIFQFDV